MGAAARALGLTTGAISKAIEDGREDRVGNGEKPTLMRECRINGKWFPSRKAAAAQLGVSRQAISRAIRTGRFLVRATAETMEGANG